MRLGDGALEVLMKASEGDMRKAVGFLQSAHDLSGGASIVSGDVVQDVSSQVYEYY